MRASISPESPWSYNSYNLISDFVVIGRYVPCLGLPWIWVLAQIPQNEACAVLCSSMRAATTRPACFAAVLRPGKEMAVILFLAPLLSFDFLRLRLLLKTCDLFLVVATSLLDCPQDHDC